jgi:hypothetical protein
MDENQAGGSGALGGLTGANGKPSGVKGVAGHGQEVETSISHVPFRHPTADDLTKYPYVKRMMNTLDAFLNRRIAGIAMLYVASLVIGSIFLFGNGATSWASSDAGYKVEAPFSYALIWSIMGVMTFLFVIVLARVVSVRLFKNNKG